MTACRVGETSDYDDFPMSHSAKHAFRPRLFKMRLWMRIGAKTAWEACLRLSNWNAARVWLGPSVAVKEVSSDEDTDGLVAAEPH